ncbi:hypothetical protein [Nocardia sp. NPDC049707]
MDLVDELTGLAADAGLELQNSSPVSDERTALEFRVRPRAEGIR